jgi:hypothetical protein
MEKEFLLSEHQAEIAQLEEELHKFIEFDEWSAREYGIESIDYHETAVNMIRAGYRKQA